MTEMARKSPVDFGRSRMAGPLQTAIRYPLLAEPGAGRIVEHVGRDLRGEARAERFHLERRAERRERRRQVHETDVPADRVAPPRAPQPPHDAAAGVHGLAAVEARA